MDDGSQLLKAMNVLMLKILENADRTSAFIVLIYLLWPVGSSRFAGPAKHGAVNVRNLKFLDLVVKCLIKLTKALKILRYIPHKVIEKLGMWNFVARPEALMCLPVPLSCTRFEAPDTPSVVTKVLMDNQYRLLQAIVKNRWDTLGQLLEAPNSGRQQLANPNVLPWEIHGS
jgi:hypothetical protein